MSSMTGTLPIILPPPPARPVARFQLIVWRGTLPAPVGEDAI